MSYFPLDRDLLTSSTWALGSPEQLKVWLYLLLAADPRTATVEDSDPAIALRCGLPLDVVTAALEWLGAPDPHSRTREFDGRRIERLAEGGFRLLTYLRRRDKDHSTPRWRRWKERQRTANAQTGANTVGNDEHEHEHEETEKRTAAPARVRRPRVKASSESEGNGNGAREASDLPGGWVGKVLAAWPGTIAPGRAGKALTAAVRRYGEASVLSGLDRWLKAGNARFGPEVFARDAEAWINGTGPVCAVKAGIAEASTAAAARFIERGRSR